jgi:serine/threonine protein kinase
MNSSEPPDRPLGDRPTYMGAQKPSVDLPPPVDRGRLADHVLIGQGGMGVIWKARDVGLDRWVAVKRVQAGLPNYDAIVSRFLQEARTLAKLKHPNIVHVYSLGRDEIGDFIEMEFIDGPSLLELLAKRGSFSVEETIRVARKVCEGLHEVHRRDIIHRDIKPSNILIDSMGQPKLIDFGIAQAGSASIHTLTGQSLGTEGYMAPEQMKDAKNVTAACDPYALAATMYHMVTGSSPRKIDYRKIPNALLDIVS